MEEFIQFSAKTKNEAITKACIELGVSSDQLEIEVVSEGSSGFFGIGSKPAIIKARKINTVSEEDEIQEIVDTVKVDAIKEEQNRKPAKPFVKAEKPAPKSEPVKEKAPVKEAKEPKPFKEPKEKQPRQPKEKPFKERPVKEKPAKEKMPKEPREEKPKQSKPVEIITDPDDFSAVRETLEKEGIPMMEADVTMIPQTWVELTDENDIKYMNRLLDLLDDDDDVQAVYHNWDTDER